MGLKKRLHDERQNTKNRLHKFVSKTYFKQQIIQSLKHYPENNSIVTSTNVELCWTFDGIDEGNFTFDIYFGTDKQFFIVKKDYKKNKYDLGKLKPGTKYYWRILIKDRKRMKTKSSVWSFTAIKPGSLRWKYETGDWIDSSPAIGEDGTVYVGSEDGFFYAIKSEAKD